MELKYNNKQRIQNIYAAFNRTAYGIEIWLSCIIVVNGVSF